MAWKPAHIAEVAAELLDELDEEYADRDVEIAGFSFVVEIRDREDDTTLVHVRSPEGTDRTAAAGRLARALDAVVDPG